MKRLFACWVGFAVLVGFCSPAVIFHPRDRRDVFYAADPNNPEFLVEYQFRKIPNFLLTSSSRDHERFKRDDAAINAMKANYPISPVEAFFGPGAHTHTFGLNAGIDWTPTLVGNHIDMPLKDGSQLDIIDSHLIQRPTARFLHGHSVGATNNYPGVDWDQAYTQYQADLDRMTGGKAPAYAYGPTTFFGRNPFKHDVSVGGGIIPPVTRVSNAIDTPADNPTGRLGLVTNTNFQGTTDQYGHAHTLDGVNPFSDVDWQNHFSNFMGRHANYMNQNPPPAPTLEPPLFSAYNLSQLNSQGPLPPQLEAQSGGQLQPLENPGLVETHFENPQIADQIGANVPPQLLAEHLAPAARVSDPFRQQMNAAQQWTVDPNDPLQATPVSQPQATPQELASAQEQFFNAQPPPNAGSAQSQPQIGVQQGFGSSGQVPGVGGFSDGFSRSSSFGQGVSANGAPELGSIPFLGRRRRRAVW